MEHCEALWKAIVLMLLTYLVTCQGLPTMEEEKIGVLLKDVPKITLTDGQISRRLGYEKYFLLDLDSHIRNYKPGTVHCHNLVRVNNNGKGSIQQWICEPEIRLSEYQFLASVTCEGFENDYPDYIVEGSCKLEYKLSPAIWERIKGEFLNTISRFFPLLYPIFSTLFDILTPFYMILHSIISLIYMIVCILFTPIHKAVPWVLFILGYIAYKRFIVINAQ